MIETRVPLGESPAMRARVLGEGSTLLLLHGFASGLEGWPTAEVEALAMHRRLVVVDLPGHGGSDPAPEGAWEPDRVVGALVELLETLTGATEADWLGYSMGGRLALHAARLGVPLRRLLLESATPGLRGHAERERRRDGDAAWARRFAVEPLPGVMERWLAQPIFASRETLPEEERVRQLEVRLCGDPMSLSRALLEAGTGSMPPAWDILPSVGDRTHLLVGQKDAKYLDIARRMREVAPQIDLDVVPGVGHAPHMEAPRAWAAWVERALQEADDPLRRTRPPG